ncbi:MAG: hypothetical protein KDK36_14045 [Leptospiraceae bacterium]|nr:hypothetical protein [Leptospiraceae bacterium]
MGKFSDKLIKFASLAIAVLALFTSVIFSQNKENKKDNKKKEKHIFHSSKSMAPSQSLENGNKLGEKKKEEKPTQIQKKVTKEINVNKKEKPPAKHLPIMPSSKAPDMNDYK